MTDAPSRIEQGFPLVREPDVHLLRMLRAPFLYHVGKVVNVDYDVPEAGSLELGKQVLEEGLASHGDECLGHGERQRTEPRPQACGEYHATCGGHHLADALFPMAYVDLDAKLVVYVPGEVLGAVYAAMLASRAAKTEHKVGKAPLQIPMDVSLCQAVDTVEEGQYLAIVLQEPYDRFVQPRQLLIGLVATGVVRAAAIEDIAAAVARRVFGYALPV